MTPVMTPVMPEVVAYASGRQLWLALHKLGVTLVTDNGRLRFDGPAGVITDSIKAAMRERKTELMAMAVGDYLSAAMWLVLGLPADLRRSELTADFDRLVTVRVVKGVDRNAAHREAYIVISKTIEAGFQPADEYARIEREAIQREAA